MPTLYVGLTDLPLEGKEVDMGDGILLRPATATFRTSLLLVNTDEQSMRTPSEVSSDGSPLLPKPAFWQVSIRESQVTAELVIPQADFLTLNEQYRLAKFICFVLRMWANPAIRMHAMSDHPFTDLIQTGSSNPIVIPLESFRPAAKMTVGSFEMFVQGLSWVQENWKAARELYESSSEFKLASDALDAGHFLENDALALVSLWAAMEALFSPSTTELRFRVSSLIASYLELRGESRWLKQKEIAALYDKRSAAAHGKPKHGSEDLLKCFELLRRILIKMVTERRVPSRDDLDRMLFAH